MNATREQRIRQIMGGEARDFTAVVTRAGLRLVEPFYATAMRLRNALFDAGIKRIHWLDRPVISIGNITTGGTGKTPATQWIAHKLLAAGHRPACLLRGYTIGDSTTSDEATLLERSLQIPVVANPDRVASGRALVKDHPETDVILLDDAFQHRRVHRDLDIVLIDATNPFGYGHVLPRGMLREPLSGLRRAAIFILTRSNLASADQLNDIASQIGEYNLAAPVLRSRHRITSLVRGDDTQPIESLQGKRIFSFCGIANPAGFHDELRATGAIDRGHRWFADHHDYTKRDAALLLDIAREFDVDMLVTTEKDWVKIGPLYASPYAGKIWRAQMEMEFSDSDAATLMSRIESVMAPSRTIRSMG